MRADTPSAALRLYGTYEIYRQYDLSSGRAWTVSGYE